MPKKILISGAGIAGCVVAHFLPRPEFDVTIIEKAPAMRTSGQAVEVSARAAKEVTRLMGVEEQIRAKGTTEAGLKFVDAQGDILLQNDIDRVHGRSFTSEEEILRSDLAQILYDLVRSNTRFIFDDSVASIEQDDDAVDIVFDSGKKETFDHLVICDGLYSKTRGLAGFDKDDLDIRRFGIATAFFTISNKIIDMEDKYAKWHLMQKGRQLLIRPDSTGKNTRAYFSIVLDEPLDRSLDVAGQKALIRRTCQGEQYVVDEILDGMDESADDFYMAEIAQMRCKSWSNGRIALCGDAAYCPSPFSGAGVDCAMIGAYILAKEIATAENYTEAFRNYELKSRPFIEEAQSISPTAVKLFYPSGWWSLQIIQTLLWLVWKSRLITFVQSLPAFSNLASESFKLPAYEK